jgi:YVTN family beta-propeller protein
MKKIVQRLLVVGMVIVTTLVGAAIGHGAPYAYIPNRASNSVVVIDQQTNKIVTTIPVGNGPGGIAVNSAGNLVYVTNIVSNSVSVINGINQTVIGSPIGVGTDPRGIVVSPDNTTVYVANYGSNTISIINAQNNTVVHTITDVPCNTLAMHPSGDLLFAVREDPGELRVIDTATRAVVGTPLNFGNNIYGIAINPTGTHLYIANYSNSVYVVRTADRAVTPIDVGESTSSIAVHPSGSFIYAGGQTNVHVIDAGTNTVVDSIDVNITAGVSFNSDGTRAYFPISLTQEVKVIDTGSHSVIDTIEAGSNFGYMYSSSFVAPHRHVWNGTTSFSLKLTGLGTDGKFVKGAGELTGRVIEMRTLGGTPESKYSLLFLSDDMRSSIYLPDVTFLMTDVDGSKGEKFMMSGTGKYYFHDGTEMISGIANFNGTGTAKRDGAGGNFTQAKMSGTVTGGILQGQYFTGKVKATLDNAQ